MTVCVVDSSSSSRGGGGSSRRTHSFDIGRQSELTRLYNQPVRRVTHVERPLTGLSTMVGPIRHSGAVVDTQDGRRFLVHKVSIARDMTGRDVYVLFGVVLVLLRWIKLHP